jgi:hypothetical protein
MRLNARFEPGPYARTLTSGLVFAGIVATGSSTALCILLAGCVAILIAQGNFKSFARFTTRFWLPLALGLFVIWGLIVRGSPRTGSGAGIADGAQFALLISLRVAALAALFQVALLSLKGLHLAGFLSGLHVSINSTATVVSIFNLWPDFSRRSEQVVASRCARGLMPNRKLWTRARQVPWIVRTLFVSSLEHSLDRAARWQAECLPNRLATVVATTETGKPNLLCSSAWCVAGLTWTTAALLWA